jgi:hypothetical protein
MISCATRLIFVPNPTGVVHVADPRIPDHPMHVQHAMQSPLDPMETPPNDHGYPSPLENVGVVSGYLDPHERARWSRPSDFVDDRVIRDGRQEAGVLCLPLLQVLQSAGWIETCDDSHGRKATHHCREAEGRDSNPSLACSRGSPERFIRALDDPNPA